MVLLSWQAIARVRPVHLMNADYAPRWPPTLRPSKPTWTASLPEEAAAIRIRHRHLLLLSPKADTHSPSHGWRNTGQHK